MMTRLLRWAVVPVAAIVAAIDNAKQGNKGHKAGSSVMFYKVSYRRGIIEGIILYMLGRLGALINPVIFPDWLYVAVPLLFMLLQFVIAPCWATLRIAATKRERLSKRFWLLGSRLAALCLGIDIVISLALGMSANTFGNAPQGPVIMRLLSNGPTHLTWLDFAGYELKTAAALFALYTLWVISMKLARGGFLRFTMPAGGNRVTL